ncbi:MAG: glycosyltransferase [Vulcanimicrobiaceae bacterium]
MERLRIGIFTEVYRPAVNGVVVSIDALCDGLRAQGHDVICFAPKMRGAQPEEHVVRIPSLPVPARAPYRLILPLVGRRGILDAAADRNILHVHSPFFTGWLGLRCGKRYNVPVVYTYHTQLEAYAHYVPFEPNATRYAASQLTRRFANLSDAVIVPTPAMRERLRDLGVRRRTEVVPTGIDLARFGSGRREQALRRRLGVPQGGRLLLFVSRLAREKNAECALEALARAADPSLRLVIAGEGPEREALQGAVERLGVKERVLFLGSIDRSALPDLYASADAFVFPSITETQGLVLVEALAAGALVLAADVQTHRDVLAGCGQLIPDSPVAWARAFREVPVQPDETAARRAKGVASGYSVQAQVERTLEIYASLLSFRSTPLGV